MRRKRLRMPAAIGLAAALPIVLVLGLGLGAAGAEASTLAPTADPTSVPTGAPDATDPTGTAQPTASPEATTPGSAGSRLAPSEVVTPTPTPGPTDDPTNAPAPAPTAPPPVSVVAPAITGPTAGSLVGGSVTITGTGQPGASVQVSSSTQSDPFCIVTVGDAGAWSCAVDSLPNGPAVALRAVQLVDGGANQSATVNVNVLAAPTAASGAAGGVTTGYGTVRGTAYPGATVTATAGPYRCTYVADPQGGWSCNLGSNLPSQTLTLRATQSTSWSGGSSAASASVSIRIDSSNPAAPTITSPTSGQTVANGATISGTGETDALVTVFAGSFAACTATVSDSAWSCTASAGVPAGTVGLSALQQDAAGNLSPESPSLPVTFEAAAPVPDPGSTTAPGTPAPTAPAGTAGQGSGLGGASGGTGAGSGGAGGSGNGSGNGSGSAPGDASGASPSAPPTSSGPGAGGTGGGGGLSGTQPAGPPTSAGGAPDSWTGATRFSAGVQPAFGQTSTVTWWLAVLIAVGALVLVAAPARLLAGVVAGARTAARAAGDRRASAGVLGRNRARTEYDSPPSVSLSPRFVTGAAIVAAAAIALLSGPIDNQAAFLRLLLAITLGFALLNAVSVIAPRFFGRRLLGTDSHAVFSPGYLVVAVVASALSRLAGLEPALLFGLVLTIGFAETVTPTARGRVAALRVASLLAFGALAWAAVSLLPASTNVAGLFSTEVLNTIVLGAFGAAAWAVLPVGRSGGRDLFDWSKSAWLGLALVSFTALSAVLSPSITRTGSELSVAPAVIGAVTFAAVSLSVWMWTKFIAPALK